MKMRLLSIATALLLPLSVFAAKKSPADKFADYNAKQLSRGGPLKLDDSSYSKLTAAPRDYSVAVLLTALEPKFGCGICHEFQPEWEVLGKSWSKGDKKTESRLVFGTLDFSDGKGTFQSVRETAGTDEYCYLTKATAHDADCACSVLLSSNDRS